MCRHAARLGAALCDSARLGSMARPSVHSSMGASTYMPDAAQRAARGTGRPDLRCAVAWRRWCRHGQTAHRRSATQRSSLRLGAGRLGSVDVGSDRCDLNDQTVHLLGASRVHVLDGSQSTASLPHLTARPAEQQPTTKLAATRQCSTDGPRCCAHSQSSRARGNVVIQLPLKQDL
jgi:hypothetical protein